MDCFKLEAETLDYLQKQHKNFNNIIQILLNITGIDQQILSLFPIDKQFQQIQQFIYDQVHQRKFCIQTQVSVDGLKLMQELQEDKQFQSCHKNKNKGDESAPSQKLFQQTIDQRKSKRLSGKSIKNKKNQKDKVNQFESRDKLVDENNLNITKQRTLIENQISFIKATALFDVFWVNISKKSLNKQQKYITLLDLAYAYLKINKDFNRKKQIATLQSKDVGSNELIQKQFVKYIQQSTCNSTNFSSIPILVKLCYRLKQIHEYINASKDLITIRNMCLQMKNNIYQQFPKEIIKQFHRNQFLQAIKQKNDSAKYMKLTYLNSLASQISINNTIRQEQPNINQKFLKDHQKPQIQSIQQVINKKLLDVDKQKFLWKYKNIKGIQSYLNIFVWRLDSCIILINQILNKQDIYNKQQFIKYLKMGKWIRDTYVCQKINCAQQKKVEKSENDDKRLSTQRVFHYKTTKQLKTTKIISQISSIRQMKEFTNDKFILQKLLFTYSNIVKYSNKLKSSKYYDMLIMELQITYRYMYKILKKNNFHSCPNIQDINGSFQLFAQCNIKDIFDLYGKLQKKNVPKVRNDSVDKKVQFIGVPNVIEQQKITQRNKQNYIKRGLKQLKHYKSPINPLNYEEIHKQIQQQQIKNEKQAYNNYFKQDSYTRVQQNFLQLLHENKRRQNFAKSLHYLTNRQSKTKNSEKRFHSKHITSIEQKNHRSTVNYHINLDGVVKDQTCQSNSQILKMNKSIKKGSNQQSIRSQVNNNQNYANIGQNKNMIQTFNKETGQVFVLAKRSPKKSNYSPNRSGNNSDNNSNPSFQLIKVKKRLGTLDRRHSFKKQIINLISITKRSIKPGRYFNQIKDAQNNRYRSILSTQQRVTVLTKQRLLNQISYIYQVNYERTRPTLNQILITPGSVTQKNSTQQQDSYSFKGINANSNVSLHSKKFDLTMVQCFGRTLGFLNIRMLNLTKINEYQISYTCYANKLINQKLIISIINKNLQTIGANNHQKNSSILNHVLNSSGVSRQDHIIYKSTFTLQELKKQIINSQFYFELIQENIEKNISGSDIYMIHSYFNSLDAQNHNDNFASPSLISKQLVENSLMTIKNAEKQSEMSNPNTSFNIYGNTNSWSKNLEQNQKANKIQSLVFAFAQRISHSLLYWYYTKGIKINGNILLKRQIPYISDPLKFAIALDFMKKYTHKQCLQKLSNVRNKKALYQCFRYLFYGRKIIIKGFLSKKNTINFYTLSLQKFFDSQFRIRTKQQGGSQFRDLTFTLTLYNKSGSIQIQQSEYPVNEVLTSNQITLLMLNNIIQQQINPKYMQSLLIDVEMRQSSTISLKLRHPYCRQYSIIEQNCQQQNNKSQNGIRLKLHHLNFSQSIIQQLNWSIKNYGNLLLVYADIIGGSVGFNISHKYRKVVNVENKYYLIEEVFLVCGLVLHIISCVKNKNKVLHITMYQIKDMQQLIKKMKHRTIEIHKQKKHKNIKCKIQSEGQVKLGSINKQKRKGRKIIKALSYQNCQVNNINENNRNNLHWQQSSRMSKKGQLNKYTSQQLIDNTKLTQFINVHQYRFEDVGRKINESFLQYNPKLRNRKSAYHSRIVISSPNNLNRNLINKLKKSIIQKQQMDFIEMINQSQERCNQNRKDYVNIKVKRIIKNKNNYLYLSIFYNKFINAYRVDLYQASSSNRFSGYFRLQQYEINEQFIRNFFNSQRVWNNSCVSRQQYEYGSQKNYYDTYYNHNYYENQQKDTVNEYKIQEQKEKLPKILIYHNEISLNSPQGQQKQSSMVFISTNTLNVRPEPQVTYSCFNQQRNFYQKKNQTSYDKYNYAQNPNKINVTNLLVLYMLNYNHFSISQDLKSIIFFLQLENKNKSIKTSLFPTFNNLSSFQGRNQGKIQLIQINTKLYLLIIFQNNPHLYLSEVDDNPYMNNVNLFADFKAKEHLVNLYTDLFMRMSVKFEGTTLTGKFYQKIRDINNL